MNSGIEWTLDSVYPGFESAAYRADKELLQKELEEFRSLFSGEVKENEEAKFIRSLLSEYNRIGDLYENLNAFVYSRYSAHTDDTAALREINALEQIGVRLTDCMVLFRNTLASFERVIGTLCETNEDLKKYRFFIEEQIFLSSKQMDPPLENLAADLKRSGAGAWSRMQDTLLSNTSIIWDEASGEKKTVTELRALAHHPERSVRKLAFEKECSALKEREIPFAYALNGIKGAALTLDMRRGFSSSLSRSVIQSRITEKALGALISVMEESLPLFRRYLKLKAHILGRERLAFYDLLAPVGVKGNSKTYSFEEAKDIILTAFSSFSPKLGEFAASAFANGWIDATPRIGKVGGAFCISFPLARESRILCNFGGSLGDVNTIAHELGHAYHHEILKDEEAALREYPMTLAETASIFSENIVSHALLSSCTDSEKLTLTDQILQDATEVIVDILSRFYFERSVFEKRKDGELSAAEFKTLMLEAQKATYGDALNETELHPYLWAVKSHYYDADLSFYNYPYAFGLLFGLGLFSLYQAQPEGFAERYETILAFTGKANAVDVVKKAGFDIETEEFWRNGIEVIRKHIHEFEHLVQQA
ncbi:MAG TPA: M3 family oligoendopeptidase [Spirochaetia bacterium]|nr:M3 family oligoendopeptidase [Spirochaetia bacterium]